MVAKPVMQGPGQSGEQGDSAQINSIVLYAQQSSGALEGNKLIAGVDRSRAVGDVKTKPFFEPKSTQLHEFRPFIGRPNGVWVQEKPGQKQVYGKNNTEVGKFGGAR